MFLIYSYTLILFTLFLFDSTLKFMNLLVFEKQAFMLEDKSENLLFVKRISTKFYTKLFFRFFQLFNFILCSGCSLTESNKKVHSIFYRFNL
jgi:hypothetical protein